MNALKSPRPTPIPPPPRRRIRNQASRRLRQHPHRATLVEVSVRLTVNLVVLVAASSALVRLLPYNFSQKAKLRELQTEVSELEGQVDQLQADFGHYFDPQQARSVMQEQNVRVDPNQRRVIWLNPSASQAEPASATPPSQRSF